MCHIIKKDLRVALGAGSSETELEGKKEPARVRIWRKRIPSRGTSEGRGKRQGASISEISNSVWRVTSNMSLYTLRPFVKGHPLKGLH